MFDFITYSRMECGTYKNQKIREDLKKKKLQINSIMLTYYNFINMALV